MTTLVSAIRAAVGGGRFVSRWTFVTIGAVSIVVLAPLPAALSTGERLLVASLTALTFGGVWALVGLAERAVARRGIRAALVGATIVLASLARPALQDAISQLLDLPVPSPDAALLRAATNLAVWTIALGGTAILVDVARSTRETNALLRRVLAQWERGAERLRRFTLDARRDLESAARALEVERPPTVAAVRSLAADLRDHAHALSARADAQPSDETGAGAGAARRRPRARWFALPPVGLTAVLYVVAVLPFAVRTVAAADVVAGALVALACGTLGDLLPRLPVWRRRPGVRAVVGVGAAVLTGAVLCVVGVGQGVAPLTAAVAVLAYPALAVALGCAREALRALRTERRRLSAAIAARVRAEGLGTRRVRAGLRDAAEVLHRDAQGAAVRFALQHPAARADEVEAFLADLRPLAGVLRRRLDDPAPAPTPLAPLLETWGRAMPVHAAVDDDAHRVIDADPGLARDVVDVVSEGLLNAAKHARVREARVEVVIVSTAAGAMLRVRVASPGPPPPRARLREGSRVQRLGAALRTGGDTTVLEAVFALDATASGSVVSTEHPVGGRGRPA